MRRDPLFNKGANLRCNVESSMPAISAISSSVHPMLAGCLIFSTGISGSLRCPRAGISISPVCRPSWSLPGRTVSVAGTWRTWGSFGHVPYDDAPRWQPQALAMSKPPWPLVRRRAPGRPGSGTRSQRRCARSRKRRGNNAASMRLLSIFLLKFPLTGPFTFVQRRSPIIYISPRIRLQTRVAWANHVVERSCKL